MNTSELNHDMLQQLYDEITLYHATILEYQGLLKDVNLQLSPSDKAYIQNIVNEYKQQKPIFQVIQKNIKNDYIEEISSDYLTYLQKISSRRIEQEEQIKAIKLNRA